VTITAPGGAPATTDANGRFSTPVGPGTTWTLLAVKPGYAGSLARVSVAAAPASSVTLSSNIRLMPVAATTTFDHAAGGSIVHPGTGATVVFPAGAFVTRQGGAVTGDVTVHITPVNPVDPSHLAAFPGSFEGRRTGGMNGRLRSHTLMDITATAGGTPVTLGQGVSANVVFPVDDNVAAPDTVPLWSLDAATGTWVEEGTATRQNVGGKRTFQSQITHLSWWACSDFEVPTVTMNFALVIDGLPGTGIRNGTSIAVLKSIKVATGDEGWDFPNFPAGQPRLAGRSVPVPASDTIVFRVDVSDGATNARFVSPLITVNTPATGSMDLGDVHLVADTCDMELATCQGSCVDWWTPCVATPSNPCGTGNGGCDTQRTCSNTPVGADTYALCGPCATGYIGAGVTGCVSISCATNNGNCDDHASCTGAAGNPVCTCDAGYSGNGTTCALITCNTTCDPHATCVSMNTCVCGSGYSGSGTTCTPQCTPACDANATCIAPDTCECNPGYSGNGVTCSPNSCAPACDINATCTGTNTCSCNPGYSGDGQSCLANVCQFGCDPDATCMGTDLCTCNYGYGGTGLLCEPVCNMTCGSNASCTAPDTCTCNRGYGSSIEGCVLTACTTPCGVNATCTGPNTCTCDSGYTGDGMTCLPQCTPACGANAHCITPNFCQCDPGFSGDGYTCAGPTQTLDLSNGGTTSSVAYPGGGQAGYAFTVSSAMSVASASTSAFSFPMMSIDLVHLFQIFDAADTSAPLGSASAMGSATPGTTVTATFTTPVSLVPARTYYLVVAAPSAITWDLFTPTAAYSSGIASITGIVSGSYPDVVTANGFPLPSNVGAPALTIAY